MSYSTFDHFLARSCAKGILALYRKQVPPTIENLATDTQVRVEEMSSGHYAILFPGSASVRDWRTNARAGKVTWGKGKVHSGFAAAFSSVSQHILNCIPANARVLIAGHSLGGALATLCADAHQDIFQIENVFTFGSPRVGNAAFAGQYSQALGIRTWRVVNAGDPVTHVPWLLGTYRHVDRLVYLNREGGVEHNFVSAALRELPERFSRPDERAQFVPAAAHNLASYITKLEALA